MAQVINYDLLKYSRSYSPDDPARFSHQPTSSDSEWQHFANPKLQLFLSNASPLLSANVKIIWYPVGGGLQYAQQETNVILEDIDLSSFSPLSTVPHKHQGPSPPLKVVYRDSVVGFRYLHPRVVPPGALPTYRRFQICFTDPLLATKFVDSIRPICPCKASPPVTLAQSRMMAVRAHTIAASGTSPMPAHKTHVSVEPLTPAPQHATRSLYLNTSALVNDLPNTSVESPVLPTNDPVRQTNADNSRSPLYATRTSPPDTAVVAPIHMNRSLQLPQTASTMLPPQVAAVSPQEPYKSKEQANLDQSILYPRIPYSTTTLSAGSSDSSSKSGNSTQRYVTSSIDTLVDALPMASNISHSEGNVHNYNLNERSSAVSQAEAPPDFLRDLCSITDLCTMSMEQLERLVGEVIREPEFPTLLEKLDAMWKVKGIITASKEH